MSSRNGSWSYLGTYPEWQTTDWQERWWREWCWEERQTTKKMDRWRHEMVQLLAGQCNLLCQRPKTLEKQNLPLDNIALRGHVKYSSVVHRFGWPMPCRLQVAGSTICIDVGLPFFCHSNHTFPCNELKLNKTFLSKFMALFLMTNVPFLLGRTPLKSLVARARADLTRKKTTFKHVWGGCPLWVLLGYAKALR
jgi:hypothetical protein